VVAPSSRRRRGRCRGGPRERYRAAAPLLATTSPIAPATSVASASGAASPHSPRMVSPLKCCRNRQCAPPGKIDLTSCCISRAHRGGCVGTLGWPWDGDEVAGRPATRVWALLHGAGSILNLAGTTQSSLSGRAVDTYFVAVDNYMDRAGFQLIELTADTSSEWASPAVEYARWRREVGRIFAVILSLVAVAAIFGGLIYLVVNPSVLSISVLGLAAMAGVAVAVGIIDSAQQPAWRRIAAARRKDWELRQ